MAPESIGAAWLLAAIELQIRVESPARVEIGGVQIDCEAFLPDFGSSQGMAILRLTDSITNLERRSSDPYYSQVSDGTYGHFDREHFIEALNDWGWFGHHAPPDWYTGTPWSG